MFPKQLINVGCLQPAIPKGAKNNIQHIKNDLGCGSYKTQDQSSTNIYINDLDPTGCSTQGQSSKHQSNILELDPGRNRGRCQSFICCQMPLNSRSIRRR